MLVCACILAIFPSKPPLAPVASVGCANATSRVLLAAYATGAMFAGGSFRPLSGSERVYIFLPGVLKISRLFFVRVSVTVSDDIWNVRTRSPGLLLC